MSEASGCPVPNKAGGPCTSTLLGRGLCHLHDPDAPFALGHPAYRARLLARPEVLAAVAVGPRPAAPARASSHPAGAAAPVAAAPAAATPSAPARAPATRASRSAPTGSYLAELEYLVERARTVLGRLEELEPGTNGRELSLAARRWRQDADAARRARPRARGEGQV